MKAIRVSIPGGREVLEYVETETPTPGPHDILIRQFAIGVNYIDIYKRLGLYPVPLPFVLGQEAAGEVVQVGVDVSRFKPGDRVAYVGATGGYAELAAVNEEIAVSIPEEISYSNAAAVMLQGMTAHYLSQSICPLKSGDSCLIHTAAGGVGLLLIQMCKQLGLKVFGTVSNDEKANLAKEAGADEVIIYTKSNFETELLRLSGGSKVQIVFDSVGRDTYLQSLDCLAPRGYLALFGQSSGVVPPIDPAILAKKGSLFLTRPTLIDYVAKRSELEWRSNEVFSWIKSGALKLRVEFQLPLAEAIRAHQLLENRETTGKVLLLP